MGEFFKCTRRTNGCVLLVIACVFMIGWLRSLVLKDEIIIECLDGDETYLIRSHDQAIRYVFSVWSRNGGVREEVLLFVPYVAVVLPLTLLSAWLILGKTKSHQKRL